MKTFVPLLLGLGATIAMTVAQTPPSDVAPALRAPEELDQIFAPIALYPDALVALILPAATAPSDIASAANYLSANGDPAGIARQPWAGSVQSLAHYPDVVKWMNENRPWTQQAGDAFLAQPADVMQSIQQLRARALAAGSLANTPQQQVLMDGKEIRIVPVQPDVIYVPRYDPDLVYEEQGSFTGPWLTFGPGFPEGIWLNYDLDWDTYGIWIGEWRPGWDYRRPAWRGQSGGRSAAIGHSWRPPSGQRSVQAFAANRSRPEIAHPAPLRGAPMRPVQARGASATTGIHPASPNAGARPDPRGYPPANQGRSAVASPAPASSSLFGGYNRGSDSRAASQRGQASRQQVRVPARASAPSPRANPGGSERKKN